MSSACPILGFTVMLDLHPSSAEAEADAIAESLARLLEAQGMTMRGGGAGRRRIEVRREGSQATDADRRLVLDWAAELAHVARVAVSEIVDLSDLHPE
jgi:uncharacterized protein YggL (DUF469 family)